MKRIIGFFLIINVGLLYVLDYNKTTYSYADDIAFYLDDTPSDTMPLKGAGYNFDHAECTNGASITWDDTAWAANINNLSQSRTKCTLYFVEDRSATSVIARLAGNVDPTSTAVIDNGTDASGCTNTLAYDDFGNLRFVGANPCNYVTFNGETAGWRIIGVIEGKVKLIRNEAIGSYSWDTSASGVNDGSGINQWGESGTYTGADLMKLLNPGYDTNLAEDLSGNAITGTYVNNSLYWDKPSGNCYNAGNNAYTTCDFTSTGLTSGAKNMMAYTSWHLGTNDGAVYTHNNINSKSFYELERSTNTGKICTSGTYCSDSVERTTTWEGYIGLMSPSDYGYAVGGNNRATCINNTNLYDYYNSGCYSEDWLCDGTYQWTMSSLASSFNAAFVFTLGGGGGVSTSPASSYASARPALYITSEVKINSGFGTSTNPYTLSLN